MSRASILDPSIDLQSDGGSVLWSIVQGEQLEFPVTLNFITNAYGYEYEAVVIEGDNKGNKSIPTTAKENGVEHTLAVRVPREKGLWDPDTNYNREDVVLYGSNYYKLKLGSNRVSAILPTDDIYWELYVPNKVFIQFVNTLSTTWTQQPTTKYPIYGFFELRITEPAGGLFQRTWKPVRGLVEFLYSPTQLVQDL